MKKKINMGKEDFKVLIEENNYYVDKSMLLKDIVDHGTMATLLTRPHGFGKTLNLSMIRRFFEDERDVNGNKIDNRHLFDELAIMDAGEKYSGMQQLFPVIKLSFRTVTQNTFSLAYEEIKRILAEEFQRHGYIVDGSMLLSSDKERFCKIINMEDDNLFYRDAVEFLSKCLKEYHQGNVIILIDDYEIPLENAYLYGYLEEMGSLMESLLMAFKSNDSLYFGIIAGGYKAEWERYFNRLNNDEDSILNGAFSKYFGFYRNEVDAMLKYYGVNEEKMRIKDWYGGYQFVKTEIYHPWSIMRYLNEKVKGKTKLPKPYGLDSSMNNFLKMMPCDLYYRIKDDLEKLFNSEMIEKRMYIDVSYSNFCIKTDRFWNFLLFNGYLKECGASFKYDTIFIKMSITNMEMRMIFQQAITEWFDEKIKRPLLPELYTAIEFGDTDTFEDIVSDLLQKSICFSDNERYSEFFIGLLKDMPGYMVVSTRKSGPDILICENKSIGSAIIFALKVTDKFTEMVSKCEEALKQIEKNYALPLSDEGNQRIIKYGVCFFKKECMVKVQQ